MSLTSVTFRTSSRLRLDMTLPQLPRNKTACPCSKYGKVDRYDNHYATGCSLKHAKSRPHNEVQNCLEQIIRYSCYRCLHEENGVFKAISKQDAHLPDISILNHLNLLVNVDAEEFTDKLVIDVSVTNPLLFPLSPTCNPHSLMHRLLELLQTILTTGNGITTLRSWKTLIRRLKDQWRNWTSSLLSLLLQDSYTRSF